LLSSGALLSILGGLPAPGAILIALPCMAALLVCYVITAIFAVIYRNNVLDLAKRLRRSFVCIFVLCLVIGFVLLAARVPLLPLQFVGLALIALGFLNSVFNFMRCKDSPEALQIRRRLASARRYFEHELSKQSPQLKDEWFPYLLAFGLGAHMDRWFKAFGAESAAMMGRRSGSSHGSASGASSGGWSGGGGTFGGAGATGSWASAVGGIASGVTAASSSSGGSSGGGGGGSSGGGGGGGW
jgi:uncharacterized membrane protein YgcG